MLKEPMTKSESTRFQSPKFNNGIYCIVGGYGSGKSEIAVNLARYLVQHRSTPDIPVAIADLDIVNPYFRSREAINELNKIGIKSIVPQGGHYYADLPIIVPEIKGAVIEQNGYVILDVGGDDVGARVLSSLAGSFKPDEYNLLLVLNANRPFTADLESTLKLMNEIEASSRLKFTGLISNTHLMNYTTADRVYEGIRLTKQVSDKTGLPILFAAVEHQLISLLDEHKIDIPLLPLNRELLKPWEKK